jgi:hypothetical protein
LRRVCIKEDHEIITNQLSSHLLILVELSVIVIQASPLIIMSFHSPEFMRTMQCICQTSGISGHIRGAAAYQGGNAAIVHHKINQGGVKITNCAGGGLSARHGGSGAFVRSKIIQGDVEIAHQSSIGGSYNHVSHGACVPCEIVQGRFEIANHPM